MYVSIGVPSPTPALNGVFGVELLIACPQMARVEAAPRVAARRPVRLRTRVEHKSGVIQRNVEPQTRGYPVSQHAFSVVVGKYPIPVLGSKRVCIQPAVRSWIYLPVFHQAVFQRPITAVETTLTTVQGHTTIPVISKREEALPAGGARDCGIAPSVDALLPWGVLAEFSGSPALGATEGSITQRRIRGALRGKLRVTGRIGAKGVRRNWGEITTRSAPSSCARVNRHRDVPPGVMPPVFSRHAGASCYSTTEGAP